MAARPIHRLDPDILITAPPGKYNDGGGLYVTITKQNAGISGSCKFKDRIGIGAFHCATVPQVREMLRQARDKAYELSRQIKMGVTPVGARAAAKTAKAQQAAEAAKAMTFKQYAKTYIEAHSPEWTNQVHADQWTQSLQTWAYPTIGDVGIGEIDTPMLLKVFRQSVDGQCFWNARRPTAERVRQRIEAILDAARAEGLRSGANPARWKTANSGRTRSRRDVGAAARGFSRRGHASVHVRERSSAGRPPRARDNVATVIIVTTRFARRPSASNTLGG